MSKIIKRLVSPLVLGALILNISGCGNEPVGEIVAELDYVSVSVDEKSRIIAHFEGDEYLLDENGEQVYMLKDFGEKYTETLIGNNTYVFSKVLKDGKIEVYDESGKTIGTYAKVPEGYNAPEVSQLLSENEILDIYDENNNSCYYNKTTGEIVLESEGGLEPFNNSPIYAERISRITEDGIDKFVFLDAQNNRIPGLEFENIHGFVKGLAFGRRRGGDTTIWAIRRSGQCFATDLMDGSSRASQCLDSKIDYYPDYDFYGLTVYHGGNTEDVIIDRYGNLISETSEKTAIFKAISEYGKKIDKETLMAALNTDNNIELERDVYAYDGGIILFPGYDTSDDNAYVFSYTTKEYTTIEPNANSNNADYIERRIDSTYVSTKYGVINMSTGELVSDIVGAVAYDEANDVTYIKTAAGFSSSDSNGKYKKYKHDLIGYIGNGKFVTKLKDKFQIIKMF